MKIEKKITHTDRSEQEINAYNEAIQCTVDVDFAAKIIGCTSRYVRKLISERTLRSVPQVHGQPHKTQHSISIGEVLKLLESDITKEKLYLKTLEILYSSGIDGLHDLYFPNE